MNEATRSEFDAILTKHPQLSDAGWETSCGDPPDYEEFAAAVEWLKTRAFRSPKGRRHGYRTTYGWKHVMERHTGVYASNGSFIAACIFCEVPMVFESPNPLVGIRSERDDDKRKFLLGQPIEHFTSKT
jgi:hypothetical protein